MGQLIDLAVGTGAKAAALALGSHHKLHLLLIAFVIKDEAARMKVTPPLAVAPLAHGDDMRWNPNDDHARKQEPSGSQVSYTLTCVPIQL